MLNHGRKICGDRPRGTYSIKKTVGDWPDGTVVKGLFAANPPLSEIWGLRYNNTDNKELHGELTWGVEPI